MKLVSTPRIEFLRALSSEILGHYGRGRAIVAIDGADAATRAHFADDLAAVFDERDHPVFRASLDHFRRSRAEVESYGPESPERLYRHHYDFSLLRRVLIDPFKLGGSTGFVLQAFDPDRDAWVQPTWLTASGDAALIIDGDYLLRRELRDLWSFSIYLETEAPAGVFRLPGGEPDEDLSAVEIGSNDFDDFDDDDDYDDDNLAEAARLYRTEVNPRSRANAVVDFADVNLPRRVFLDAC